jgi:2-isopropylmalate synthase
MTAVQPAPAVEPVFTLDRWSASSASNRPSRANLVILGADRAWRAHASGNGAVDALLRAVDTALGSVLGDGVELQTYNVHAAGQGHDTEAMVTVSLRLRSDDAHAPAYPGRGVHDNVLEASVLAYVDAINRLVAHGRIDVAAAAPAPGETARPVIHDKGHTPHDARFTEMFNH